MDDASLKPEQRRQESKEEPRINTEEQDLEDRVERDQRGHILVVAPGKLVPDDDHGNAAGQPDEDQALHVLRLEIGRESCRVSVCQYVSISVDAYALKKKNDNQN